MQEPFDDQIAVSDFLCPVASEKLYRFGALSLVEAYLRLLYTETRRPCGIAELDLGMFGAALCLGKIS